MGTILPPLSLTLSIQYKLFRDMLSAGMNSPLYHEIREKRGLAYNMSLQVMTFQDVSILVFSVATQFSHMPTIESLFWEQVQAVLTDESRFEEIKHMLLQTILYREYSVASLVDEAIDSYLDFGRVVPTNEITQILSNMTLNSMVQNVQPTLDPKMFASVWVNCRE
jgi:predicted Zn-dependent peptidase